MRNRDGAITGCGLTFVKLEFGSVFPFLHAPWGSEGNHRIINQAGEELFKSLTPTCSMWRNFFYERITLARYKGVHPVGFGTLDLMFQMWWWSYRHPVVQQLNPGYAANRWASWSEKFDALADGGRDGEGSIWK